MNPSLGLTTTPRRKAGQQPARYDCGRYGRLTCRQIAHIAGIKPVSAWNRANRQGLRGDALVEGTKQVRAPSELKPRLNRPALRVACKLAVAFPCRVPTTAEIMAVHPMSRNAANNYRAALAEAWKGLAA